MPQEPTTEPANPAPTWPTDCIAALWVAGVQEKTIPFCIRRMRGFFAEYPGRRRWDTGRMEIEAFPHKTAA